MNLSQQEQDRLIQYLLGFASDREKIEIEDAYLSSDELNDEIQAAERELMDRYLEGGLSETERERFENFFLCSPGRRERLRFARALVDYGSKLDASPGNVVLGRRPTRFAALNSFVSSYARILAFAAVLIVSGLIVWRVFLFRSPEQQAMLALTKAYSAGRLAESRVSGVGYAPMAQSRGGSPNLDAAQLHQAELIALQEVTDHPGAPAFHMLGRVYLAEQQLDRALEWLGKATEASSEDAGVHSDLGAALLESGRQEPDSEKRAEQLIRSRDHLDKALQLDDALLEARFNRALWYEYMHLPEGARAEWQEYLQRDSQSGWAQEARRRLALLEQNQRGASRTAGDVDEFAAAAQHGDDGSAWKILSRNRTRSDNTITERLLDEYLDLAERDGSEATARLRLISFAGKLELERIGDRFTSDLATYYLNSTARQRQLARQGRSLLKSGLVPYAKAEFERAAELYRQGEAAFIKAGDTCEALVARTRIGDCYLRVPFTGRALASFERLVSYSSQRAYRLLLAQSLTSVSDAELSRREFSKGLDSAARSLDIYESVQDLSGTLRSLQACAVIAQEFGRFYKSTGFATRALDIVGSLAAGPREVWPVYQLMASNMNALGFPSMALGFAESALRLAVESGAPLLRSRSYALLALIHQKLHSSQDALKNGQLALAEAQAVESEKVRANLVAHATLKLAHVHRELGAFDQAVLLYDQSIELHRKLNQQFYVAEAHLGKLESLIALKDDIAIGQEIKTSIGLLEQDRSRMMEDANRSAYFDLAQSTYDIAVDFASSNLHDGLLAFAYSEASHARSLLDLISGSGEVVNNREGVDVRVSRVTRPLTLTEIQSRLPKHCQILHYAVLEDKLVAWVISTNAV